MGQAIPVRTDYTAGEVRRFTQRAKDAAQARSSALASRVMAGRLAANPSESAFQNLVA